MALTIRFHRSALLLTALLSLPLALTATAQTSPNPVVNLETSIGNIQLELYPEQAPVTVKNFLRYVSSGHYNLTLFHRVIPDFVIQGGGYDTDMVKKPTEAPIANEASNGLKNLLGSISMARTSDPNSATSQFFINLKDNTNLDQGPGNAGYAVFGKVIKGMEVVEAIALQPTQNVGMFRDIPLEPIVLESATVLSPAAAR